MINLFGHSSLCSQSDQRVLSQLIRIRTCAAPTHHFVNRVHTNQRSQHILYWLRTHHLHFKPKFLVGRGNKSIRTCLMSTSGSVSSTLVRYQEASLLPYLVIQTPSVKILSSPDRSNLLVQQFFPMKNSIR